MERNGYKIEPGADLRFADLRGADLRFADLRGADLRFANLRGAILPAFQLPAGELIVFKSVESRIVRLRIPRDAPRTASLVGRKCRAAYAVVEAIEGGGPVTSRPYSGVPLTYAVGAEVRPDKYDDDPRVECTHGVHFYATEDEAREAA